MQDAGAEGGCQGKQEQKASAKQAAFGAGPAGQLPEHCQNIFADAKYSGHGGENHKQEKQSSPDASAGHILEYRCHSIKKKAWPGIYLKSVGEAGGEHNNSRDDGNKGVQKNNMDGFSHERVVFADIAAEDSHAAHARRQSKKCLIHGAYNNGTVDFGKIRFEVKAESLRRTA